MLNHTQRVVVFRVLTIVVYTASAVACRSTPIPPPSPLPTPARAPITTPATQVVFLPLISGFLATLTATASAPEPSVTPTASTPEPPTVVPPTEPPPPPTPSWPEPLAGQTLSKMSFHVLRNEDPYVMEFVRRVHPPLIKGLDDMAWLLEVKAVSPGTVTIGRFNVPEAQSADHWPDTTNPIDAAHAYVETNLAHYRQNPGVDYWEGWNEFVPVTEARWHWYASFEGERACYMQTLGLHAAIGGFPAGTPEYNEMAWFIPALEAAHRCGAIFTLHEGVSPILGCGVDGSQPIPGAPALNIPAGYMMLRYRYWYEGYLKPRGLGDVPLVMSELAMGGIVPGSPCNGPGGAGWKPYQEWWVQQGVAASGPEAYVKLLIWYDSEMQKDSYVLGATIFTAGAISAELGWQDFDVHEVIIPLAVYAATQQ